MTSADLVAGASRSRAAGDETFLVSFRRGANGSPASVELVERTSDTSAAETPTAAVLFDGVLYNGNELAQELGLAGSGETPAAVVAAAYDRLGEAVFARLSGIFGLVVRDERKDRVLVVRDPLGLGALYYAETGEHVLVSTTTDALVAEPRVAGNLNRAALADHLCHRWPDLHETYYSAVRRVPPGHVARFDGTTSVRRYWDPAPSGPVDWVEEADLVQFDHLFEQAVTRGVEQGPLAIYLSGGLDSVAVAAVAAEATRRRGLPLPLALSLVFDHPACNEEETQRSVAAELGFPQRLMTVDEAVGPGNLVASALEMAAASSAPMLNLWNPPYHALGLAGRDDGRRAILTGSGGDEWLGVSPFHAADLLRRGDVLGLYRVWQSTQRSYHVSRRDAARNVVWDWAVQPVLRRAAVTTLERVAPGVLGERRQLRLEASTPEWVAPAASLRDELAAREERRPRIRDPRGFYVGEMRRQLDTPVISLQLEEMFERGRKLGMRLLHPFWDSDLAAFLYRTPPRFLMRGERTKGLVRDSLERRFPGLGFRQHRKLSATDFFTEVLLTQGTRAWRALGGAAALAELGVVDAAGAGAFVEELARGDRPGQEFRLWYLLSLESWARARI